MELIFYQFLLYISCIYCYNIDEDNYLIFNGKTGSHFGFSTALLRNNDGIWLLVGAPNDNFTDMPDVTCPGNIYKCPVNFTQRHQTGCEEMVNLRTGEDTRLNHSFSYEESNQLLGANLLVSNLKIVVSINVSRDQLLGSNLLVSNRKIVTCPSLWKYVRHEFDKGFLFAIGYCFEINKDLSTVQKKRFSATEFPYGMAQIGFSTANMNENPVWDFLLGAPGMNNGKGGFVYSNSNKTGSSSGSYSTFSINVEANLRNTTNGTNFGYTINTGKFGPPATGKFGPPAPFPLVLIGTPRYSNEHNGHVGAVLILEAFVTIVSKKILTGDQIGSGFGSALCVADINGDGKDDLLVGAPYYTYDIGRENVVECGKVHIYYGTGDSDYTAIQPDNPSLLGMKRTMSRFGLAITNIGNINADSFNDIAIGAPYEDDMNGAVYIYNGRRGFISNMYSQRISGRRFVPMLKGFGMQISAPLDVDNNQYPDFAVGAYMSDTALILRPRPIINLTANMSIIPDVIPLNSSGLDCSLDENQPCLTILLCFRFEGKVFSDDILVDFEIRSDTGRTQQRKPSRLRLSTNDGNHDENVEVKTFRLLRGINTCTDITGRVQAISKEFFSVIADEVKFEAEFMLSNTSITESVPPILNERFPRKIITSTYFEKQCSGKCRSNLVLEITVDRPTEMEIVINQTEEVVFRIHLQNTGQPSYATTISIQTSNNTSFLGSQVSRGSREVVCKLAENNTLYSNALQCDIDKELCQYHFVDFVVRFDVTIDKLLPCQRCYEDLLSSVAITAVAETHGSIEVEPSNNQESLNVPIKFLTDLEIIGISTPEQHKLSEGDEDYIKFIHEYRVYNNGPSPLPSTTFILDIPVQTREIQLVDTTNISVIPEFPNSACRLLNNNSDPQHPLSAVTRQPTTSTSNVMTSQVPPSVEAQPLQQNAVRPITNITCERFGCVRYECTLGPLDLEEKTSFRLVAFVKKTALPFGKNNYDLRFNTRGEIHQPQHRLLYPWSKRVLYQTYIDFFPETFPPQPTKLSIWIIVGGCVGGLALIIILFIILWRCGFFKRKQKTYEFKEWKRQSTIRNRQSQRTNSTKSSRSATVKPKYAAEFAYQRTK